MEYDLSRLPEPNGIAEAGPTRPLQVSVQAPILVFSVEGVALGGPRVVVHRANYCSDRSAPRTSFRPAPGRLNMHSSGGLKPGTRTGRQRIPCTVARSRTIMCSRRSKG